MDADKEREELLNEFQGLKEELARLKEAASEYKQQYQAIKETKDQLNVALEASTDAIVATNQEGKITLFNQAAEELFQYSSQEVIGQPIKIFSGKTSETSIRGKWISFCPRILANAVTLENEQNGPSDARAGVSLKQKSGCLAGEAAENA